MQNKLKFLLVDDHALVRAGLGQLLASRFKAKIVEAGSYADALSACEAEQFALATVDISLPDRNGLEVLAALKAVHPALPVLMLSMHGEEQFAIRALRAGAAGYLTKGCLPEEVMIAVEKLLGGGRYVTASLAEQMAGFLQGAAGSAQATAVQALSGREFDVLQLISRGKSGKEIAAELSLSYKTVSTYRTRILGKLHLRTNAELVAYAVRSGFA